MTERLLRVSALVLFLLGVLGLWLFLFREVELPLDVGTVGVKWRWGRVTEFRLDGNGDGVTDYVARGPWSMSFTDAGHFTEGLESLRCDGFFDLRMEFEDDAKGDAVAVAVELDGDRDGVFEERVEGEAAPERLRELRDLSECIPWWIENIDREDEEYFRRQMMRWREVGAIQRKGGRVP